MQKNRLEDIHIVRETMGSIRSMPYIGPVHEAKKAQKSIEPHWVTVVQNEQPIRLHINERGLVDKGPSNMIGVNIKHLPAIPGKRDVWHHPGGHTPPGFDSHPDYGEHNPRIADHGSKDGRQSNSPHPVGKKRVDNALNQSVASHKLEKMQDSARKKAEEWARQQHNSFPSSPFGKNKEEDQDNPDPRDAPDLSDDESPFSDIPPEAKEDTGENTLSDDPDQEDSSNDRDSAQPQNDQQPPEELSDDTNQDDKDDNSELNQNNNIDTNSANKNDDNNSNGDIDDDEEEEESKPVLPTGTNGDVLPIDPKAEEKKYPGPAWALSDNPDKAVSAIMGPARKLSEQKAAVDKFSSLPMAKDMPSDLHEAFQRHGYMDKKQQND